MQACTDVLVAWNRVLIPKTVNYERAESYQLESTWVLDTLGTLWAHVEDTLGGWNKVLRVKFSMEI